MKIDKVPIEPLTQGMTLAEALGTSGEYDVRLPDWIESSYIGVNSDAIIVNQLGSPYIVAIDDLTRTDWQRKDAECAAGTWEWAKAHLRIPGVIRPGMESPVFCKTNSDYLMQIQDGKLCRFNATAGDIAATDWYNYKPKDTDIRRLKKARKKALANLIQSIDADSEASNLTLATCDVYQDYLTANAAYQDARPPKVKALLN